MEKTKELAGVLYHHHFVRYLFVGGTTFIIDFGLLVLLHGKHHVRLAVATSISYWIAVTYNFSLNRWWTFSTGENKSLRKHIAAYSVLLGINYLFTVIFVSLVGRHINYALAKALAIPIQMTWTYFAYKNFIFVRPEQSELAK